jgi:CHAT domain-containing protein/tetratricopeptide (TPR) repeat protein
MVSERPPTHSDLSRGFCFVPSRKRGMRQRVRSPRARRSLWLVVLIPFLTAAVLAPTSSLDDAFILQHEGKLRQARDLLRAIAANSRSSADRENSAKALSSAADISISLGDYGGAVRDAQRAIELRRTMKMEKELGKDFDTIGRANQYLGNYPAALENYQAALGADRDVGDRAGEITLLNNIGNIHYFLGQYSTALENYQDALQRVYAASGEPWALYKRQLTNANIAVLYQRVGLEQRALDIYERESQNTNALPANERAQLLLNEGVLYRRMGDPIKALELYGEAQSLFRSDRHVDGEIGAFRNIGIAEATDLADLSGALRAFTAGLELSKQSSNSRGIVQASLYRGEVLRRLHREDEAKADLEVALAGAQQAGLIEEQWKSLYALGQIDDDRGLISNAVKNYQEAIKIIESIRASLRVPSLKTDFLADKRDVYDSLIAVQLRESSPPADDIFRLMERSRARTLLDRIAAQPALQESSIENVRSHLPPDTVLVEFWMGKQMGLSVWITSAGTGLVKYNSSDQIGRSAALLTVALERSQNQWRRISRDLGSQLLSGIPVRPHTIVVPDGPLNIPFEVLGIPNSDSLLIEVSDVSVLPSARFVVADKQQPSKWLFPWDQELVAFGNPPVSSFDPLAQQEHWQPLPASASEVRKIAGTLAGKATVHLGRDARKSYLLNSGLANIPLLHFATHAVIDAENPDRSRILLAADSSRAPEYLFQSEVYDLNLRGVDLVTVSACDTARGKMVRGEGILAFSQAFLAAGAAATVTSLWKVADGPTMSLMQTFYYFLARGETKSEALRDAKLQFFKSKTELSAPVFWAAFIVNGDGWHRTRRAISWSTLLFALAALMAVAAAALRLLGRSRPRG